MLEGRNMCPCNITAINHGSLANRPYHNLIFCFHVNSTTFRIVSLHSIGFLRTSLLRLTCQEVCSAKFKTLPKRFLYHTSFACGSIKANQDLWTPRTYEPRKLSDLILLQKFGCPPDRFQGTREHCQKHYWEQGNNWKKKLGRWGKKAVFLLF